MKQTDQEIERIFGKKPRPIDKTSMLNRLDSEFREAMIRFIRGFGLKETNGEYHRFFEHWDFSGYSDDQISKLYLDIRNEVVDAIMDWKIEKKPSAYYSALIHANETVKDNSISILIESK